MNQTATNANLRVSDADRDQVAERLREHFAQGRLTPDELDERVAAALSAKTYGQLRAVMADLPEPEPAGAAPGRVSVPGRGWTEQDWSRQPRYYRRGPRLLPLALLLLFAIVLTHGAGFVVVAVLQLMLLFFVVTFVAGLFAAGRFRRRGRRYWR